MNGPVASFCRQGAVGFPGYVLKLLFIENSRNSENLGCSRKITILLASFMAMKKDINNCEMILCISCHETCALATNTGLGTISGFN